MMNEIRYTAPNGATIFFGATKPYNLNSLEGISNMAVNVFSEKSPYNDGANIIDTKADPRIITVNGTINESDYATMWQNRANILTVCNPLTGADLGTLTLYYPNGQTKTVQAKPLTVPLIKQKIPMEFMIQFIAPIPFWQGAEIETAMTYESGRLEFDLEMPYRFNEDLTNYGEINFDTDNTSDLASVSEGEYVIDGGDSGLVWVIRRFKNGVNTVCLIAIELFPLLNLIYDCWEVSENRAISFSQITENIYFDDGSFFGDVGIEISTVNSIKTITNSGDVATPMLIEFTGEAVNPKVLNNTTGAFVEVNRTLTTGQKLIIDSSPNAFSVTLVDVDLTETSAYNYITADSRIDLMLLGVGANEIEYTSDNNSTEASVVIKYKNQFIGV